MTLKVGSSGEEVKRLQNALGLKSDGKFGPATEEALKNWQKNNGLDADGIAGQKTLEKILGEKSEEARQVIRRQREDIWNKIQAAQKAKEMSEDDKFRGKDELQKVVDDYNEKIKNLVEKKKQELV